MKYDTLSLAERELIRRYNHDELTLLDLKKYVGVLSSNYKEAVQFLEEREKKILTLLASLQQMGFRIPD
jgi:hypothetical protein